MIRARVSLAVAGVVSAAAAVWFASSWLDSTNGDSTCGSLWQVGTWPHGRGCSGPMTVTTPPRRALFVSLAILVIAGSVLAVNENVRSDGLWARRAGPGRGNRPLTCGATAN